MIDGGDNILEQINSKMGNIERLALIGVKKILTINELSLYTGLKVGYIYKLTSAREIPYYKPNGKVIYFHKDEIDRWMLANRHDTDRETEIFAQTMIETRGRSHAK